MAQSVSGILRQRTVANPYEYCLQGQNCTLRPDGFYDWAYERPYGCFGTAIRCSTVAGGLCPLADGVTAESRWETNDDMNNTQAQGRLIRCTYHTSVIASSTSNVQAFLNAFGPNDDYDNVIMPLFCSQRTEDVANCPTFPPIPVPVGGTGFLNPCVDGSVGCSRMTSSAQDGVLCRQWRSRKPELAYTAENEFCLQAENLCAGDCRCYNRNNVDPIYQLITEGVGEALPTNAACWYNVCQEATTYLIPENQNKGLQNCPTTICQQVVNIIGNVGSSITVDIAREEISCPINNPGLTGSTGGNPPSHVGNIWEEYGGWIILGITVFLVIVVIIIIIAVVGGRKRAEEKPNYKEMPQDQKVELLERLRENQAAIEQRSGNLGVDNQGLNNQGLNPRPNV